MKTSIVLRGTATLALSLVVAAVRPALAQRDAIQPATLTLDSARLTIPDAAPDGSWVLTGLRNVQLLRDGGFVITTGSEIHRFTAQGRHLPVLGRKGQGPGEFTGISGLAECPDGRLIVTDWLQRRLTEMPAAPAKPQTMSYPVTVTHSIVSRVCEGARVIFTDQTINTGKPSTFPPHTLRRDTMLVIGSTAKLGALDTIARIAAGSSFDGLRQPFGGFALIAFNSPGIAMGRTDDSVIQVLSRPGMRARRVVVKGLPVIPVTADMRAQRTAQSETSTPPSIWQKELRDAFANVPWPARLPLWERLLLDDRSRVWVAEYRSPLDSTHRTTRWRVVTADGALVGTLLLPAEDDLVAVRGDDAIVVHRNDDDSESIQVRRIRGT